MSHLEDLKAFTLITTPDKSWNILSSDYRTDVSETLGDDMIKNLGGELSRDFNLEFTSEQIFNDQNKDYVTLSENEKEIVDAHITKNGLIECVPTFKAEAQKLGDPTLEQSCNPTTKGMDADYFLIFIAGERIYTEGIQMPFYTLEGGGDESKKTWFTKISNHQMSKYIEDDNITPTKFYMENTTLGMLTPFTIFKYVEPNTGRTFDAYQNGLIPVYVNDLKFKDPETDPFYLVYASPSFYSQEPGIMSAVLIYKINHDYNPQN